MKIPVPEAAEYLECSPTRVLELLRTGVIPGVKLGQSWVIPRQPFYEAVAALAVAQAGVARDASNWGVSGASMRSPSEAAFNQRLRQVMEDMPMAKRRGGKRLPRSLDPVGQL